ncbi:anthrone oxygenase family protein [Nocardia sp. CDC160]|uniref:anthrone oxygenase family protein n=1 Tax=Nocardia sp. CDC160 TaxID=3112166 RepID=UPI002DBBB689|nr:anthrone oxygenase family protein [Nocardia sp. CDC160]MEC3913749.1 anthrone oxygenase family protein [Nocardia sp. CDC160]
MFAFRTAALVAATLTTGLVAGVFYAYAISVMPALHRADDRTLIDVMQKINVVIINPWFMLGFLGTVGFTVLAAALHLGKGSRTTLIWIGVALLLNIIAFAVTSGLNVPLNNQLANAGDVGQIGDLAAVRAQFETSWVRWNVVRALLHTLAFLVLTGALFVAGMQHARAGAVAQAAPAASAASAWPFPVQPGFPPAQQFAPQPGFGSGQR